MAEDPTETSILKRSFRQIYIEIQQIKCCYCSFLGWGLGVIYNSEIQKQSRPLPRGLKILKLKLGFFFQPFPPILEIFPEFFPIKIMTPPLRQLIVYANFDV